MKMRNATKIKDYVIKGGVKIGKSYGILIWYEKWLNKQRYRSKKHLKKLYENYIVTSTNFNYYNYLRIIKDKPFIKRVFYTLKKYFKEMKKEDLIQ